MPGMNGLKVLQQMMTLNSLIPVLLISAYGNIPLAIKATQNGAVDFIEKPINARDLLSRISHQLEIGEKLQITEKKIDEIQKRYGMIGTSQNVMVVYQNIDQVAPTNVRVLITGETGVGKELVANAIHSLSKRSHQPFIKLNCAAIPSELIESELFGYRKGSFTGAFSDRQGKFQKANNAKLFLDEIGDMSMMTQAKVLRVLEQGEVQPIGDSKIKKVDVRIIAATNKNLDEEVESGRFREDLFYRLNVVKINMPVLSERKQDIPHLADYFLSYFCEQHNKKQKHFSQRALEILINEPWNGNIRELRNLMEKFVIFVEEEIIDLKHVQNIFSRQRLGERLKLDLPFKEARDQFEKEFIETKLIINGWKIGETANQLGVERTNLYRKMKQLGIEQPKPDNSF